MSSLAHALRHHSATFYLTAWLTAGQEERATGMACILRCSLLCKKAWNGWIQLCVDQAFKREQIQAARASNGKRIMQKAYRTWLLHSAERARHTVAMISAEAHDQRRCTAQWFGAWRALMLAEQRQAAIRTQTAAVFCKSYAKNVCFGWWRRWVSCSGDCCVSCLMLHLAPCF